MTGSFSFLHVAFFFQVNNLSCYLAGQERILTIGDFLITNLFCHLTNWFCMFTNWFCMIANLICNNTKFFCDIARKICNVAERFCDLTISFCHFAKGFCGIAIRICKVAGSPGKVRKFRYKPAAETLGLVRE